MNITRSELVAMLDAKRGAFPVTITARTKPVLVKTNKATGEVNPWYGKCEKVARVNGLLNWIYANSVNNQRDREGQPADAEGAVYHFTPKPRQWGVRLQDESGRVRPFVEHKGKKYLELKVQKSLEYQYETPDRQVIPQESVNPFLPKRVEGARQEVDNPIILRDYDLDNIQQIAVNGELFTVIPG